MPSLVVERGQEKGFSYAVPEGAVTVVGRDPSSEVVMSDPAGSRRHFQIRQVDGAWTVMDLGSRNHTFLNEQELTKEEPLAFGDRIQVGETVFSFLEEEKTESGKAGGLAGKDIGGYKILDRIGRGGMGTVYKARQISLNRICAMKMLSAKFATDPDFVQQFVAEARAAGQLQHPNVVQVFDVGQSGGLHFFSMEFMEGGAVQDLLAKQEGSRLPWTEAMPMIKDACQGLVFAEKHGIIHRDIKPDNLMLSSEHRVKLGDLGLAKKTGDEGDGKIFGTPHFIAPEQARGKGTNHSSDIYSLGATFYRMVAGRTPFTGQSVKEILRKQINDPHTPLTEEIEGFPADLSAIVDKMMAKSQTDRYVSASDLLADLEAFELAHQIELSGLKKVNKPLLAAGAVLILALAGVVIWQVMKPKEVKTVIEKGDTIIKNTGVDPEALKEAEEAKRRSDATAAYFSLVAKPPQGAAALEEEDAWREKANRFDQVAKDWVGTPAATDATKQATTIRETLDELRRTFEATVGQAKTWWDREQARLEGMLEAKEWTAVLQASKNVLAGPQWKQHGQHVPAAKTYLEGMEAEVLKRVRAEHAAVMTSATATLSTNPRDAVVTMQAHADALRRHAAAHDDIQTMIAESDAWVTKQSEQVVTGLLEQLAADRLLYVDAVRSLRRVVEDEWAGDVFAFRFTQAADALARETAGLNTWIYQRRAAAYVQRLRDMQTAWDGFIAELAAGNIVGAGEPLSGVPRVDREARATLDFERKPDVEGFRVNVNIAGGSIRNTYKWDELTPDGVYTMLLAGRVDRVPPQLAAGLAWAFVETGYAPAAAALLMRARTANVAPAVAARLAAEVAALSDYRTIADAIADDTVMARVVNWRERHRFSETFVSLDGRPAEQLPTLFPTPQEQAFLDSWGQEPVEEHTPEKPK